MKITKKDTHYYFENEVGSYHLSIEDYNKFTSEKEATSYVEKEIIKKSKEYLSKTITFKEARKFGFCEYGIKDFCNKLGLDITKEYKLEYISDLITEDKLDLMFKYENDLLKLFGLNIFKQYEEAISKDAYRSYLYAKNVLKSKFELGEEAISKNAYYSYLYARDVLKDKFKLGEETISKDAEYAYWYARDILNLPEIDSQKMGKKIIDN